MKNLLEILFFIIISTLFLGVFYAILEAIFGKSVETDKIFLMIFIILLCGFGVWAFIRMLTVDKCIKRQKILREMYSIPDEARDDDEGVLCKNFHEAIEKAIGSTSDATKLSDLKQCQSVVTQLNKGSQRCYPTWFSPFSNINKAFRLTGCHIIITDSEGKTIKKIV